MRTLGSLRRLALDGNLSVDERSRPLLAWSIASAAVENDDQRKLLAW